MTQTTKETEMGEDSRRPLAMMAATAATAAVTQAMRRRRWMDMNGRVVLITGGTRGLGLIMATEFGRRGARLVLCGRDEGTLTSAERHVATLGVEAMVRRCDVAVRQEAEELVREATLRFGRIDVLVNNAGIMTVGPLQAQSVEDFEEAMGVMFWGIVYPTLAVLPQMLQRREGRIVNITSIGGKVSAPHVLPYCSAKFAAVGFSEGLHAELARDGIRVVTVVPGFMRTGSHLNASYKGKPEGEFLWFSLGPSVPGLSIDAERAARRIVDAAESGEAELILSILAKLATRVNGLAPGFLSELLALANRLLPSAQGGERTPKTGRESRSRLAAALTVLGERAARRFNQYPGGQAGTE